MADRVNKQTRSRVMAAVRSCETGLEQRFEQLVREMKLPNFRKQVRSLPGTPDFVFEESCVAVFVDSCFWHGCKIHCRKPSANSQYWEAKLRNNKLRDRKRGAELRDMGWKVLRVWEHELNHPQTLKERLLREMKASTPARSNPYVAE